MAKEEGPCSVASCVGPSRSKGLCSFHYKRQWAGVPLDRPIVYKGARRVGKICEQDGSVRPIKTWNLCGTHHERKLNGLDMSAPIRKGQVAGSTKYTTPIEYRNAEVKVSRCVMAGCDLIPRRFYLTCKSHTSRLIRFSLTPIQFQAILDTESCQSCGESFGGLESSRHIDHDHSCCPRPMRKCCGLCIRGVLCQGCNTGLGAFREDESKLLLGVQYLRRTDNIT